MIATVTLNPSLDKTVTVDRLIVDETNRWTRMRSDPGGKGINVSRVIHVLGGETIAYSFVGGLDGQVFQQLMERRGVPFDFIPIRENIRSNFIITNLKTHRQTRIDAPGPQVTEDELERLIDKVMRIEPLPEFIVFAGSVPPGIPTDIYFRLITDAKKRGIKTVLDSDKEWLKEGIKALPSIIKPNVFEAEMLLGVKLKSEEAIIHAVKTLCRRGFGIVAISRGKLGMIISDRKQMLKLNSPDVEIRSTVGAGDSAIAGLVIGLSRGMGLEDAARLAVASGAATAITPGTELCHREDIERLFPLVEVQRLSGRKTA
jgi:6-phosphofructokinase 2